MRRTKELRSFIYSIQMIEAEMTYSYESLQQIFINVQQKTDPPITAFYARLADKLANPVYDFYTIWQKALQRLRNESTLKKEELNILSEFGKNIGNHTIEQQKKQIKLTIYYLQKSLDEAIEQNKKYNKMVQSISVLFGIFIVLILI